MNTTRNWNQRDNSNRDVNVPNANTRNNFANKRLAMRRNTASVPSKNNDQ